MPAMSIESIVCQYNHRKIDILKNALPEDYIQKAAKAICNLSKGYIFIITGFCCFNAVETDGPVGSYFLAKALQKAGFNPVIISDYYTSPLFQNIDFPVLIHYSDITPKYTKTIIEKYQPVALISIERAGRAEDGHYYNMNKQDISAQTLPLDNYFINSFEDILTIGIGDGGNEIGMGNLSSVISTQLDIIPSTIKVNHLIVATVSNWGAFGLIKSLELQTGLHLFPDITHIQNYLEDIVSKGAVDGILGPHHCSVDGFDFSAERRIFESLKIYSAS